MQRSSPSIGTLAAALAKAQGELVNPEKSLVATIRVEGPRGTERTFRYAPLSSGLDIVRKILGQHEIATLQTTSIDQGTGIINLTTVLAHGSGEWIASDWPVCAISETATPHRMGAALTYARRYALFTLVGIAGEDDLDAPDLPTPTERAPDPERPKGPGNGKLNGAQRNQSSSNDRRYPTGLPKATSVLGAEPSAQLRDRLHGEVHEIGSSDGAAMWAHKSLADKNKLTAADAQAVEQAFQAKLETLGVRDAYTSAAVEGNPAPPKPNERNEGKPKSRRRSASIDKSVLAIPEPRRVRDGDHVRSVAQHFCLICGRRPAGAHHLRFAQSRALHRKVSDEFTVPLCRGHHREVHRCGDETAWWQKAGVDPTTSARALWLLTHPLPARPGIMSEGAGDVPADSHDLGNADDNRPIAQRDPNYKTKPIIPAASR
jgi:ERF superfamily